MPFGLNSSAYVEPSSILAPPTAHSPTDKPKWLTGPLKYISVASPVRNQSVGWIGSLGLNIATIPVTIPLLNEVFYGRQPPRLLSYCPGSSKIEAMDQLLLSRDEVIASLRNNLLKA